VNATVTSEDFKWPRGSKSAFFFDGFLRRISSSLSDNREKGKGAIVTADLDNELVTAVDANETSDSLSDCFSE